MGERVSIFQTKQKETQETIHATDRKLLISIIMLRGRIRCWFDSTKTGIFEKNIFQFRSRREEKMNRMKKRSGSVVSSFNVYIRPNKLHQRIRNQNVCGYIDTNIKRGETNGNFSFSFSKSLVSSKVQHVTWYLGFIFDVFLLSVQWLCCF